MQNNKDVCKNHKIKYFFQYPKAIKTEKETLNIFTFMAKFFKNFSKKSLNTF